MLQFSRTIWINGFALLAMLCTSLSVFSPAPDLSAAQQRQIELREQLHHIFGINDDCVKGNLHSDTQDVASQQSCNSHCLNKMSPTCGFVDFSLQPYTLALMGLDETPHTQDRVDLPFRPPIV